jgi:ADP-ribose pyrophosphatase YjhB (NUDIX family)
LEYLGYRDDPDRDPRAHNIAHAFYAKTVKGEPKAGDDAKAVVRVDPAELDTITFAFPDHKEMILKALMLK